MLFQSIRDLLPDAPPASVNPEATLFEASEVMHVRESDAVLVVHENALVGILTETDLIRHASQYGGLRTSPVSEAMTRNVRCIETRASLSEASRSMTKLGLDHLPVVDTGGKVVGMLRRSDIPEGYYHSADGGDANSQAA